MKTKLPKQGRKTKLLRVDPSELKELRSALKKSAEWQEYANAPDSVLVQLGIMFARLHLEPDTFMLTLQAVNQLVNEAVQINVGEVARIMGGVAHMNPDMTISVSRPESDSVETFKAKPVKPQPAKFIH